MSNPCSFRIMTPTPVLCKSSKTAPSKYSLYIGLQGGFQCSVRLIRWPVTAWVVELPELQIAWNSCQNSIALPAMTLGCLVDCSKTQLFLAFQIIQDSIRDCSTVLSQPSSNTGQIILTKSRNSCSNYLFSAAPNSCASSQFHNSCIMSSSFNLQLGHHGYVRNLLFTRLDISNPTFT